jgi:hypothetical protein
MPELRRETVSMPVPSWLTGVWRRLLIDYEDGSRDVSSHVLWLQTRSLYADIRIPRDRPGALGRKNFSAFDDAELCGLARQQGFAGTIALAGDRCTWHRHIDLQPAQPTPDEGRLRLQGDVLVEAGVHTSYIEHWRREDDGGDCLAAFRLTDDSAAPGRTGVLVLVGDHFLEVQSRREPLPPATSLANLVGQALSSGRRDRAERLLDMRICQGRIDRDRQRWTIEHATLPWLEGTTLHAPFEARYDPPTGTLTREIDGGRQLWRLDDTSMSPSTLADAFAAAATIA